MSCFRSYAVPKRATELFTPVTCYKYNYHERLAEAFRRAMMYQDTKLLPTGWNKEQLLDEEDEVEVSDVTSYPAVCCHGNGHYSDVIVAVVGRGTER